MLKGSLLCFQKVNYTLAFITSNIFRNTIYSMSFGNLLETSLNNWLTNESDLLLHFFFAN